MNKYIYILMVPAVLFLFGCEDDDDKNSSSDDGTFTNCFDGSDAYGACASCGYYDDEADAQGEYDCITCQDGYEIDVYFDDCTGYCVPEGTADNPISSSDCEAP